ncbi:hypothetical protein K402DRAFT_425890 [Aulographum hederae CBS 113979]|uniref:Uncharacterized protein n=1 Tax=Aulographum hederae CBS 113979 TaxID=1176131 RepID=A0A6G1GJB9_9PEZI|nr:hypothetical protein K402DRAFT_425890 [Aulographum hederae CBS 113979]
MVYVGPTMSSEEWTIFMRKSKQKLDPFTYQFPYGPVLKNPAVPRLETIANTLLMDSGALQRLVRRGPDRNWQIMFARVLQNEVGPIPARAYGRPDRLQLHLRMLQALEKIHKVSQLPLETVDKDRIPMTVTYYPPLDGEHEPIVIGEIEYPMEKWLPGTVTESPTSCAAMRLIHFFCSPEGKSVVGGKNIVELGAGLGLVSVSCAAYLGTNHVIATDGHPYAAYMLDQRLESNMEGYSYFPPRGRIEAHQLDWTDREGVLDLPSKFDNGKIDLIFGADLVNDPEQYVSLLLTLGRFAEANSETVIMLAVHVRYEFEYYNFEEAAEHCGFEVSEVEFEVGGEHTGGQTGYFHGEYMDIRVLRLVADEGWGRGRDQDVMEDMLKIAKGKGKSTSIMRARAPTMNRAPMDYAEGEAPSDSDEELLAIMERENEERRGRDQDQKKEMRRPAEGGEDEVMLDYP